MITNLNNNNYICYLQNNITTDLNCLLYTSDAADE